MITEDLQSREGNEQSEEQSWEQIQYVVSCEETKPIRHSAHPAYFEDMSCLLHPLLDRQQHVDSTSRGKACIHNVREHQSDNVVKDFQCCSFVVTLRQVEKGVKDQKCCQDVHKRTHS